MSSQRRPSTSNANPPRSRPEQRLTVELEPTGDGGQRALLYPDDSPGHVVATNWLAVPADVLVELDDAR